MSAKSERLIRDLAQLFVKYSLSDWQPILDELRKSSDPSRTRLVDAIEAHVQFAKKARLKSKPRRVSKRKPARRSFEEQDDDKRFRSLLMSLSNREILRTAAELKAAALAIGIKEQLPNERRDAARLIVNHLRGQSQVRLQESLQILRDKFFLSQRDPSSEFDRWVAVIMRPRELT